MKNRKLVLYGKEKKQICLGVITRVLLNRNQDQTQLKAGKGRKLNRRSAFTILSQPL